MPTWYTTCLCYVTYLEPIIFLDVSSSFSLSWLVSGVDMDVVAVVNIAAMIIITAFMIYVSILKKKHNFYFNKCEMKCNYYEIREYTTRRR